MFDAKATIRDVLMNDQSLRDMLPNRKSFIKSGDMNGDVKTPVLTFRDGPMVNTDERLFMQEVYVRIYDHPKMGTINIARIGRRMHDLLHLQALALQDGRFVKCKLNNTLGELEDPAFGLTFVEFQFRVLAL